MKIGVIGAGTWGVALARMLTNSNHDVVVWSAIGEEIDALEATRTHKNLPGAVIPEGTKFTKALDEAVIGMDILLLAVPSVFVRATTAKLAQFVTDTQIIVNVAKGIEENTLFMMTEVIRDELEKHTSASGVKLLALSGPTHAEEVARDLPTTIISACEDEETAKIVQDVFMNTCMRVYTHFDVLGVELSGALKNIIALATGISSGLGFGDNTKAALITRGIAEIRRLGLKMGCHDQTFAGLAGIGDLIVTATSEHSRNNRCGRLIGSGVEPKEAIKQIGMVVEGINALPAAIALARKYDVEMPITETAYSVIFEGVDPKSAVLKLMTRDKKAEVENGV